MLRNEVYISSWRPVKKHAIAQLWLSRKKKEKKNVTNKPGNSFFSTLILLPVKCGTGAWANDQDATGPYALSVVVVLRANLKPEAPLSALLPTNNEIERFLGREHDQTGRCFIDIKDRKYSFQRRGEDPLRWRASCEYAIPVNRNPRCLETVPI